MQEEEKRKGKERTEEKGKGTGKKKKTADKRCDRKFIEKNNNKKKKNRKQRCEEKKHRRKSKKRKKNMKKIIIKKNLTPTFTWCSTCGVAIIGRKRDTCMVLSFCSVLGFKTLLKLCQPESLQTFLAMWASAFSVFCKASASGAVLGFWASGLPSLS